VNINLVKSEFETPCLSAQICLVNDKTYIHCSSHGKCFYDVIQYYKSNKTTSFQNCVCDEDWTDLIPNPEVKCCYKRKSQFMAFILELVVGFGLGHFYIGNSFIGYLKLISYIVMYCACCSIGCCFCNRDESYYKKVTKDSKISNETFTIDENKLLILKILNFIMVFSACGFCIWQVTDAILFGLNFFRDSNGIELKPW
jgi:hypothetical protein